MIRTALVATAFAALLGNAAFADDSMMKCDEASMMKMQTEMNAMKDDAMKANAMKEMDMAKKAMDEKKMDDCTMHMDAAKKAMKG